jgi:hypothetical protein
VKWAHASRYSVSHKKLKLPWSTCTYLKLTTVTTWTRTLGSTARITPRNWMFAGDFIFLPVCVMCPTECLIDYMK